MRRRASSCLRYPTAGDRLAKYIKFAIRSNKKKPSCRWRKPDNHTKQSVDPRDRNTGILTGPINNLLVVDVDVKNEGVVEFLAYAEEHGNQDTFTVGAPSGGLHYCFNYTSPSKDDEVLIKTFLKNASEYRGKGIESEVQAVTW